MRMPPKWKNISVGKETVLGFLVGQVMRESRGKANPATVQEIMKRQLAERKK